MSQIAETIAVARLHAQALPSRVAIQAPTDHLHEVDKKKVETSPSPTYIGPSRNPKRAFGTWQMRKEFKSQKDAQYLVRSSRRSQQNQAQSLDCKQRFSQSAGSNAPTDAPALRPAEISRTGLEKVHKSISLSNKSRKKKRRKRRKKDIECRSRPAKQKLCSVCRPPVPAWKRSCLRKQSIPS